MGLTIKCPFCQGRAKVRTSDRPTPTTVTADIYCSNCGNFKGKFFGEITDIKKAHWQECNEAKNLTFEENKIKSQP